MVEEEGTEGGRVVEEEEGGRVVEEKEGEGGEERRGVALRLYELAMTWTGKKNLSEPVGAT